MPKYYVDTCIFLNIWEQEIGPDPKKPFWKGSTEFIKKAMIEKSLHLSSVVLKELRHTTDDYSQEKSYLLEEAKILAVLKEDAPFARWIEKKFPLSEEDALHYVLAKRHQLILITRDKKLLSFANKHGVIAYQPEEVNSELK